MNNITLCKWLKSMHDTIAAFDTKDDDIEESIDYIKEALHDAINVIKVKIDDELYRIESEQVNKEILHENSVMLRELNRL
jgi:hypothetical protein